MSYQAKKFDHLLGLSGLSAKLMNNHFKLYEGYVANANKLNEELKAMSANGQDNTPAYAELKRRFGWEFNGMRLHEYYFGSMTKEKITLNQASEFYQLITDSFGSLEAWQKDFKATGMMRGIGWVILYYDQQENRLFNTWVNEHDLGHLAGCQVMLNLDMFEHAFMIDGLARDEYIDNFLQLIDWVVVEKRLTN